jgi:uncharacterized protein (TIGR02996 family)
VKPSKVPNAPPKTADDTAVRAARAALKEAQRAAAAGASQDAVHAAQEALRKALRNWDPYLPHRPFLDAIDAAPNDPRAVLAWAEWLEKHDDGFPNAAAVRITAEAGVLPRKSVSGLSWELPARPSQRVAGKAFPATPSIASSSPSTVWLAFAEHEHPSRRDPRG